MPDLCLGTGLSTSEAGRCCLLSFSGALSAKWVRQGEAEKRGTNGPEAGGMVQTAREGSSFLAGGLGGQLPGATPLSWFCGWQVFSGKTKRFRVLSSEVNLVISPFKVV